jgi:hypothetical protein
MVLAGAHAHAVGAQFLGPDARMVALRCRKFRINLLAFAIVLSAGKCFVERGAVEFTGQVAAKSSELGFRCHAETPQFRD